MEPPAFAPHTTFFLSDRFPGMPDTLSLMFAASSTELPLGNAMETNPVSAAAASNVFIRACESRFGPIIFASRSDTRNPALIHDVISKWERPPTNNVGVFADAVIVPYDRQPFAVSSFLVDAPVVVAAGPSRIGYIRCTAPALFAGLLDKFKSWWPDEWAHTSVFMGPCITGRHFPYNLEDVPEEYQGFAISPDEGETQFDDQHCFGLDLAIMRELNGWMCGYLSRSDTDPYEKASHCEGDWSSQRFSTHAHAILRQGTGHAPRQAVMLSYYPSP